MTVFTTRTGLVAIIFVLKLPPVNAIAQLGNDESVNDRPSTQPLLPAITTDNTSHSRPSDQLAHSRAQVSRDRFQHHVLSGRGPREITRLSLSARSQGSKPFSTEYDQDSSTLNTSGSSAAAKQFSHSLHPKKAESLLTQQPTLKTQSKVVLESVSTQASTRISSNSIGMPGQRSTTESTRKLEAVSREKPRTSKETRTQEYKPTQRRTQESKNTPKTRIHGANIKRRRSVLQKSQTRQSTRTWETLNTSDVEAGSRKPENETHLHLSAADFVNCSMQTHYMESSDIDTELTEVYKEVFALQGTITVHIVFGKDQLRSICENLTMDMRCKDYLNTLQSKFCGFTLRVPEDLCIAVEVLENPGTYVRLFGPIEDVWITDDFNVNTDTLANTMMYISSSNVVNILQYVLVDGNDQRSGGRFVFRFRTLRNPGLHVRHIAFNRGVVETPLYQDQTALLTAVCDEYAYVKVPSGHVVMISSRTFVAMTQCVALYAGDRSNETVLSICLHDVMNSSRSFVFNLSLLLVNLYDTTDSSRYESFSDADFQLVFSFHNRSAIPAMLPDNTWNCSVPHRADFLYHLSCNMEVECQNAEDEMVCSYTTELCGPGYLTLGGACFFYLRRPDNEISWIQASDLCVLQGGRLAALNTMDKWNEAMTLLSLSPVHRIKFFVGIKRTSSSLRAWYRGTFQWTDGITGFDLHVGPDSDSELSCDTTCGFVKIDGNPKKSSLGLRYHCAKERIANVLCEKPNIPKAIPTTILINGTEVWAGEADYVACPLGHYTHTFLACDVRSSCWFHDSPSYCESSPTSFPPFFTCNDRTERVPYELVCDDRRDCVDHSDEDFCSFPSCKPGQFSCDGKQCVLSLKVCDGWRDCYNGEDEERCSYDNEYLKLMSLSPPGLVTLSHDGRLTLRPLNATQKPDICPRTHFQCLDNGYCLPVFLRCNGVYDCPGREDETDCDTCPGFYRCRASKVCVHYSDLCDGHAHCLQHDDELMCNSTCPPSCVCRGLTFFCPHSFNASAYPLLRYLDGSGSAMTPEQLTGNLLLVHLILANCSLTHLRDLHLPNLISLNIQHNKLISISYLHLVGVPKLRELSVAGNALKLVFETINIPGNFPKLQKLDLSWVVIHDLNVTVLSVFPNLYFLNLSNSGVQRVQGTGFRNFRKLRVLDLRGCPIAWFPREIFDGLSYLQNVYADSFKMCCPAVLPLDFNLRDCFAPWNHVSSCDDLLRGNVYRVCVFALSFIAVVGNSVSFVFRTFISKRENKLGYGNFVTHLAVSDFLMGVYLAIIGLADQVFHGTYLWNDVTWRHSFVCKLAGFLSLLSSEVSALIMCLITIDRFLVLRFPFSHIHFSHTTAHVASLVVWTGGMILVSVPLLPVTSHWELYSQTGICIPLPISGTNFAGEDYSFGILIVFNFVVFVVISIGQLSIYWSVRANAMSVSNTTKKTKDLTIARRLITVAMSDFLCWFPIGVLGLLASSGSPIPGEVNVAMAIFVLPLNSAVNPCLYTVNVILERRGRAREEKLRTALLAQLKSRH